MAYCFSTRIIIALKHTPTHIQTHTRRRNLTFRKQSLFTDATAAASSFIHIIYPSPVRGGSLFVEGSSAISFRIRGRGAVCASLAQFSVVCGVSCIAIMLKWSGLTKDIHTKSYYKKTSVEWWWRWRYPSRILVRGGLLGIAFSLMKSHSAEPKTRDRPTSRPPLLSFCARRENKTELCGETSTPLKKFSRIFFFFFWFFDREIFLLSYFFPHPGTTKNIRKLTVEK